MANQQLTDYIANQLQMGVSREVIKSALIESGWPEAEVSAAMSREQGVPAKSSSINPNQVIMTSDILEPKNEPVFDPAKKSPSMTASAGQKIDSVGTAATSASKNAVGTAAGGAAEPLRVNAVSKMAWSNFLLPGACGILCVAVAGTGYFAYALSEKKSALELQVQMLNAERADLTGQLAAVKQEKNTIDGRVTELDGQVKDLLANLAIFQIPAAQGTSTAEIPLTVKGMLHGGEKTVYSITTAYDITVTVKNYKDPKVTAALKPFVGSVVELSGTHAPSVREITVTGVNGQTLE
jgi:multidrug efflux pump subunit AcrA (membrane-fusion protein)